MMLACADGVPTKRNNRPASAVYAALCIVDAYKHNESRGATLSTYCGKTSFLVEE